MRDARAEAVTGLPMTLVVAARRGRVPAQTLSDGGLGGYSADVPYADAMRGSWTAALCRPQGPALAETSVLVEDFEPERLAFELTPPRRCLRPMRRSPSISRRATSTAPRRPTSPSRATSTSGRSTASPAFPGYSFGLEDDTVEPSREPLEIDAATDADGKASFDVDLPRTAGDHPALAPDMIIRVADTNGRAVERTLDGRSSRLRR